MTAFVVTGADLHEAAAWASRIVPAKPVTPLLAGLLLEAGDELSATAFDFETCGRVTVPATVKESGRLLLSARLLAGVAKTVNRDVDVVIEENGGMAEVKCGRAEWSMPVMSVDEYPTPPSGGAALATVDAAELRRALTRVLPAVGHVDAMPALSGVRVEAGPGTDRLTLVATDRYRLATATIPLTATAEVPDATVPADLLEAAVRAAGTGPVGLSCDDSTFGLASDDYRLVGRQIAEEYPRWRGMVPDLNDHFAVVDVAELQHAVAQAQVMAPDAETALQLLFGADCVRVSASDADRRARAEVAVQEMHGDGFEARVKAAYLQAALVSMESEVCAVHFYPRFVQLVPRGGDGAGVDYRHLVMYRHGKK